MLPLKDLAIKKALENKWQEAYSINQQLFEENPDNIDTLNRLAFSLIKLGKYKQAKDTYKKVLEIDNSNPIAVKNLKKLSDISKQHIEKSQNTENKDYVKMENLFIEEAGKTKTIDLKNIADKKTLSLLQPGDPINLVIKRSKIFAQSNHNKYVGMLPDSIGMRLIPFMKSGSKYQAFIKSIQEKTVVVFIKEIQKSSKFRNQPSFASGGFSYHTSDTEAD